MSKDSKELICNQCCLQFENKYGFDLHLSLVHKQENEFIEDINLLNNETKTLELVGNINETNITCTSNETLNKGGFEKLVKCDICDASYKYKKDLKLHISSIHEGKKPFKCEISNSTLTFVQ